MTFHEVLNQKPFYVVKKISRFIGKENCMKRDEDERDK